MVKQFIHKIRPKANKIGYLYIAPYFAGFLCFNLFPIIFSFYMGLTKWDIFGASEFIGFENYINLLTKDPVFMIALKNTFIFMIFSMVTGISISLFFAAILAEDIVGNHAFRVIFYLPFLVVPVAFGMMMKPIFGSENYGLINQIIKMIGIKPINWLEDPKLAIWTVVGTNFWLIGGSVIIFLAGVKGIPASYYEAAHIDGAGWWSRFFNITLPLLKNVIFFQVIMGLIYGLQIFDIPASLAGMGQNTHTYMGKNNSLATLLYYLFFKGFRFWEMGAASAIGWIVFLIGLVFTVTIIVFLKKAPKMELE